MFAEINIIFKTLASYDGVSTTILRLFDRLQERAKLLVNDGKIFNSIDLLVYCCNVEYVSLFYRNYNRLCSSEIIELISENNVFLCDRLVSRSHNTLQTKFVIQSY